ncbi:MAG: glycosyltransferase family 4 protein [Sphingomonadales bacterium]|nr:glycosyltransferase family 4 protein [Sphingomonadales bacterium]
MGITGAWARAGWDVTVVTLTTAEHDFFALQPGVRHLRVVIEPQSKGFLASIVSNVRRIVALRRTLSAIRPHVSLGMMSSSAILLAFAGLGLPGRKYGSERVYPPMLPLHPGKAKVRRYAYGLLDGVVCQTAEVAKWVALNTRAKDVPVVPNPISLPLPRSEPTVRPADHLSPGASCLLAVGRLSEQKQFDRLVETFARIAADHPLWKLVILGDGPDRNTLEAQARALGMSERIHLLGSCGNLEDWYRRADLFVLTSRFEGFPNVLLEAMAHGAPVVAMNCPTGPSDMIEDRVDGILVPPDDFEALEATLRTTMTDASLRARLATAAEGVNARFATSRIMELWNRSLGLPTMEVGQ